MLATAISFALAAVRRDCACPAALANGAMRLSGVGHVTTTGAGAVVNAPETLWAHGVQLPPKSKGHGG